MNFTFVNSTFETYLRRSFFMKIFNKLLLLIFYPINTYLSSIAYFISWLHTSLSFTYCKLTTIMSGPVGNKVKLFGGFEGTFQLNMKISTKCLVVNSFSLLFIICGILTLSPSHIFYPNKTSIKFILWKSQKFWL